MPQSLGDIQETLSDGVKRERTAVVLPVNDFSKGRRLDKEPRGSTESDSDEPKKSVYPLYH
jgi:hypothetical protein